MKKLFISLVAVVTVFCNLSYAESVLSKTIMTMPTLLVLERGAGSGFIGYDDKFIYLVTARHVLFKADKDNNYIINTSKLTTISRADNNDQAELKIELDVSKLNKSKLIKFNKDHDIAIIRIGSMNNGEIKLFEGAFSEEWKQYQPLFVHLKGGYRNFDQVLISNNIFIFGYPTSIGIDNPQIDPLVPLLRKGIVAGKNYKNKKIIIDAPSYQGNSGGPVIMIDDEAGRIKFLLIGIVVEFVPYVENWLNDKYPGLVNTSIHNTGYSVVEPMDFVIETISMFNDQKE